MLDFFVLMFTIVPYNAMPKEMETTQLQKNINYIVDVGGTASQR